MKSDRRSGRRRHTRLEVERLEARLLLNGTPSLSGNIDLNTGTGTGPDGIVRILGDDAGDQSGGSVASVGDVDGDGYDDLVIGAYLASPAGGSSAGEAYLVLGRPDVDWADVDLSAGTLPDGVFRIWGDDVADACGVSVAGLGDVNDDGYDDFAIGAYRADPAGGSSAGETYVVFGRATGDWDDVDLDTGTGTGPAGVVRITGDDASDQSGLSVAGAGDVNDDGYDDIIIGAFGADSSKGEAYLVFGRDTFDWDDIDLDTGTGTGPSGVIRIIGDDAADYCGWSVAGAGDVDGDGFDDLLVGALNADPGGRASAGETYLIFGRSSVLWDDINLGGSPSGVVVIMGDDAADGSGARVSGAGDVDGDGYDDFLIGAQFASPSGGSEAGEVYLVFGRERDDWDDLDLSGSADGVVRIYGDDAGDHLGVSISGAGDVNDDGYDDFVIGAYEASPTSGSGAGEAYLVLGRAPGEWSDLNLNTATGPAGVFRFFGDDAGDACGVSVSGGGDVNGDGYDDIVIGARSADPDGRSAAGESYLVLGGSTADLLPDLVVDNVTYAGGIYAPGTLLDVLVSCSNDGQATAQAPFYVELYLSTDTVLGNGDDVLLGSDTVDQSMAAYTFAAILLEGAIPEGTAWGSYYVVAVIDPLDQVFEDDEANNEWWSASADVVVQGDYVPVAQFRSGDVLVSVYDVEGGVDVDPDDITVKFSSTGVSSIKIGGDQAMDGLGIVISGAASVGSIKDSRGGVLGDVAFIASDAPISSIKLKSGMSGHDLNGLTLGGIAFDADIDGDADTDDATALYSEGAVGSVKVNESVDGDVWIGGADSKGRSLKSFRVKYGGLDADIFALADVSTIKLGGSLTGAVQVGDDLGKLQVKYGSVSTDMLVMGDLDKVQITGGDLTGSLAVGGDLGKLQVKYGGASADVQVAGDVSKVQVSGGNVSSVIDVAGSLSKLQVKDGAFTGQLNVDGALKTLDVDGNMAGAIVNVGADLSKLKVRGSLIDSVVTAAGALSKTDVYGDYVDSNLIGGILAKVKVRGDIRSTDATDDAINAAGGSFYLYEGKVKYEVLDALGVWLDGVHAFVG